MNYQEALDRLENFAYHGGEKGNNVKIIQELVNEKLEQESRKDKLIVGSEWECVANCYFESYGDALKIQKGEVTKLTSYHNHTLAMNRGIMPTQQFLLCFRPLKEGDKDDR